MSSPVINFNSGTSKNCIEVANGCFARQFGDLDWQWLRLAVRYRFHIPSGYNNNLYPTVKLFIGFCHGTENIVGTKTPQHAWGIGPLSSVYLGHSYTSTYGDYYIPQGSTWNTYLQKYESGSYTQPKQLNGAYYYNGNDTGLDALFFDLTKSLDETKVTFNVWGRAGPTATMKTTPLPDNIFLANVDAETPHYDEEPYVADYNFYTNLGVYDFDETTYGKLNAVNISWNFENPKLQIEDLYVVKLA